MVPLEWYLILAAALFCTGLYAILARRNVIVVLMGVELMLNAVNINLLAFWRYAEVYTAVGQAFAAFVYVVAAAEVAVGVALVVSIWRARDTVALDEIDALQG
jgi:NADH-quinone oxidoreductase subunit K